MPLAAMIPPSFTTDESRSRGREPSARRTPNSRVLRLTEKARTPATPTTAIATATNAKAPNASVSQAIRFKDFGANVGERGGVFHGLFDGQTADDLRDGADEAVRIDMCVDKQSAAPDLHLFERLVNRESMSRFDVFVIEITDHAHDSAGSRADVDELHYRVGPGHIVIQRVAAGEHARCDALADDHDGPLHPCDRVHQSRDRQAEAFRGTQRSRAKRRESERPPSPLSARVLLQFYLSPSRTNNCPQIQAAQKNSDPGLE